MPDESALRQHWAPKLCQSKGFDSEAEFLEPGRCFACGMEGQSITARKPSVDEPDHLLCEHCHRDSHRLSYKEYSRWFNARNAADTIAAYMTSRVARIAAPANPDLL